MSLKNVVPAEGVRALHKKIEEDARIAIADRIPRKILALNELINKTDIYKRVVPVKITDLSSLQPISAGDKGDGEQASKKRKLDQGEHSDEAAQGQAKSDRAVEGQIKSNQAVLDIMELLKKEIMEGAELVGVVKTWIQLNIPKIEDGNNFGVGVQEECASELSRAEDACFAVLDSMTKYFQNRARLVYKMVKHPLVLDYKQAVVECDEMHFANLRLCVIDLRNNYAAVHDLLKKNIAKIEKPRSNAGQPIVY